MPTNTQVQIVIKGLAYCQPVEPQSPTDRGQLLVTFIHPDIHHNVRMTIKDKIGTQPETSRPVEMLANGSRIEFTAADIRITSPNPAGTSRDDVTNIFDLHREARFRVDLRSSPLISRTHLLIPSSNFYSRSQTLLEQEYWIYNTRNNTKNLLIPTASNPRKAVANDVKVDFDVPPGLTMGLNRITPDPKNFPLMTVPDISYTVEFDNSCHDHSCGNDFGYYYELLDNSANGVEMDQFTVRLPIVSVDPETQDAACNPIWGDPPF